MGYTDMVKHFNGEVENYQFGGRTDYFDSDVKKFADGGETNDNKNNAPYRQLSIPMEGYEPDPLFYNTLSKTETKKLNTKTNTKTNTQKSETSDLTKYLLNKYKNQNSQYTQPRYVAEPSTTSTAKPVIINQDLIQQSNLNKNKGTLKGIDKMPEQPLTREEVRKGIKFTTDVAGLLYPPAAIAGSAMDMYQGDKTGALLGLIPGTKDFLASKNMATKFATKAFNLGIPNKVIQPSKKVIREAGKYIKGSAEVVDAKDDIGKPIVETLKSKYKQGGLIKKYEDGGTDKPKVNSKILSGLANNIPKNRLEAESREEYKRMHPEIEAANFYNKIQKNINQTSEIYQSGPKKGQPTGKGALEPSYPEMMLMPGSLPIKAASKIGKAAVGVAEALNPIGGMKSLKPTSVSSSVDDIGRNLADLQKAQKFAQQYGYELPANLERISQSNMLTDRTIRGMMDRHNTFVRGVSTNWDEIAKRNPEILRHLESKGIDWQNNPKAAAEYMATHIPINTGYGRASLNTEVFDRGLQGLYTSNSIPTAEGYTYGQGFITKVKKPTDFFSPNRQDWITKNNPHYRDEDKFRELMFPLSDETKYAIHSSKSKMWTPKSADEKLLKNATSKQKAIKEVEYRIEQLKKDISEIEPNKDKWIDAPEVIYSKKELVKQLENDIKYLEKHGDEILQTPGEFNLLRTERSNLPTDPYNFLIAKEGNAKRLSEWLKKQPYQEKMREVNDLGESLRKYSWDEQQPIRAKIKELQDEVNALYNQSVQDYMKANHPDYDPINKYAHYIHLGTPGQKVLEPIKSWEITPEIWKNKSRAHTNKYSKKFSALKYGGFIGIGGAGLLGAGALQQNKKKGGLIK
jgi:hypothetical protein